MKKLTFIIIILLSFQLANCQKKTPKTKKYAGTYMIGDMASEKGGKMIEIYPESDSTVLFYVHIQKGAPSYNSGRLYGRIKILNGKGNFITKSDYMERSCEWAMLINEEALILTTQNSQYDCGFGNGVVADGEYTKAISRVPKYFFQGDGEKIYFSKVKPEQYHDTL
jgi:hypothetical protein